MIAGMSSLEAFGAIVCQATFMRVSGLGDGRLGLWPRKCFSTPCQLRIPAMMASDAAMRKRVMCVRWGSKQAMSICWIGQA